MIWILLGRNEKIRPSWAKIFWQIQGNSDGELRKISVSTFLGEDFLADPRVGLDPRGLRLLVGLDPRGRLDPRLSPFAFSFGVSCVFYAKHNMETKIQRLPLGFPFPGSKQSAHPSLVFVHFFSSFFKWIFYYLLAIHSRDRFLFPEANEPRPTVRSPIRNPE